MQVSPTEQTTCQPGTAGTAKWIAPVAICALLALPVVFLAIRHKATPPATPATAAVDPISALEEAVRVQPSADNRLNLSLAYINAHRQASAIPVLQALLKQDPNNAKAWNNLCVARNMQSEFGEALDACRHAVTIDPTFQLAQNNLNWASAQRQNALNAAATAEALAPQTRSSQSYIEAGLNLLHAGEYDRAIALWQPLAVREPNNAILANDIGVAYMMKHMQRDAAAWFKKASELDPTLQIAKNNLAWAASAE